MSPHLNVFRVVREIERHWLSFDPVWRTLVLSALLGFLYGCFIDPLWIEPVELGQVVGNSVRYPVNDPWYYEVVRSFSLLTLIPAFLVRSGISTWILSVFMTGVLGATAFSSVALTALVLTDLPIFSCLVSLLLINYQFPVYHYYPVIYPITMFCFGQFGLYLTLLLFSLFGLRKTKAGAFCLGFFPAWHVGWAIPAWFAGLFIFFFERKRINFKVHLKLFVIGGILVLATLLAQKICFPNLLIPSQTPYNRDAQLREIKINRQVFSQRDESGNPSSHGMLILESPEPVREIAKFFSSEIYFLFLFFVTWRCTCEYWTRDRKIFVGGLWTICLLAVIYKVFDEADPDLNWLVPINAYLPYYVHRTIPARWLNLDMILAPVLMLSSLAVLAFQKRNRVAAILLFSIVTFATVKTAWVLIPLSIYPHSFYRVETLFPILFCICLFLKRFRSKIGVHGLPNLGDRLANLLSPIVNYYSLTTVFISAFLIVNLPVLGRTWREKPFLGHDQFDSLAAVAAKNPGVIILAPGIKSRDGFNPQIRTQRPIELPGPLLIFGPSAEVAKMHEMNLDVYCLDVESANAPFHFAENIKTCFEKRDLNSWQNVGQKYQSTSVLTLDTWKLNLPIEISAGGLTLYRIPGVILN